MSLTRRDFLTRASACAGYFAAMKAFGGLHSGYAWAASSCVASRKVLVHIFLDGGLDSASLLIPRNLQSYFDKRQTISYPNPGAGNASPLTLDSRYGLHPALTNINNLYQQGKVALVNKVGYPEPTRSHDDSKSVYSRAIRNNGTDNTGWAGRFGDVYCAGNSNIASVISFRGNAKDISARSFVATTSGSLAAYRYENDGASTNDSIYRRSVIQTNRSVQPINNSQMLAVNTAWGNVDNSVATMAAVNALPSGAAYQNDGLSQRLRDTAKLIRSDENPSIILLSVGGFDTHGNEVTDLSSRFTQINNAIGSFWADLQSMGREQDVVLHMYTEFGRNTFENTTRGTDHGHGTMAMVIGSNINGGVHGPEYTEADFASKPWLDGEVDFREVLSDSIAKHLGVDPAPIFPEAFGRTGISIVR